MLLLKIINYLYLVNQFITKKNHKLDKANLLRMAKYLKKLRVKDFSMETYKTDAIFHCVDLDKEAKKGDGFLYYTWSLEFTKLGNHEEWLWCFGSAWYETDDTAKGCAKRIEWLVEKGLPEHAYYQMRDIHPLCYRKN